MALYSLFCGDKHIVDVHYKAENRQCLSKKEQDEIRALGRETYSYQNFDPWLGFGYAEIKLKY